MDQVRMEIDFEEVKRGFYWRMYPSPVNHEQEDFLKKISEQVFYRETFWPEYIGAILQVSHSYELLTFTYKENPSWETLIVLQLSICQIPNLKACCVNQTCELGVKTIKAGGRISANHKHLYGVVPIEKMTDNPEEVLQLAQSIWGVRAGKKRWK